MFEPVTVEEWVDTLSKTQSWETAYPLVHQLAVAYLQTQSTARELSTHELAEALFPLKAARSPEEIAARKRMFKALLVEPKEPLLIDRYRVRGAPRPMYVHGKKVMAQPWVWRNIGGDNG